MLGVAGAIGADARVPGMVLLRAPLGRRGSYLPTGVNVLQGIGWSVFELLIIATAAAALSDELFGFRAQWLWTLVFGGFALLLALLGPIGFVRRFVRRIAVWAVPFALLYLTWWALDGADLGALWDTPGTGGLSVWQGADIVVAITVSWVPLAADYTRFSSSRRAGGLGTGLGYFVPGTWLLVLGVVLVLSRDLSDPAALPTAVVAGGFAAIVALFALLVTETDEAFANIYSAVGLAPESRAPRVAATPHHGRDRDRDRRRAGDRPRELPELPLAPGIRLRAALRRACSPTGSRPAAATRARRSSKGRRGVRA